jgi:hypothetical protein
MRSSSRTLSPAEINTVAGGLQYQANDAAWLMNPILPANATHLVVMPDPGFVVAPEKGSGEGGK